MTERSVKSGDDKLRIVLSVLRGDLSPEKAARQEGVSPASVRRWRDKFLAGGRTALDPEYTAPGPPRVDRAPGEIRGVPMPADDGRHAPSRYLEAIRLHWLLIIVIVAVGVASAAVYSVAATKRYQSGADILVTPISSTDSALLGFNLPTVSSDPTSSSVLTAARMIDNRQVADAVRARLGLSINSQALLDSVTVQPVSQADILSIVASASTADQAAKIANVFADETLREQNASFQSQLKARIGHLQNALAKTSNSNEASAIQTQLAELTPLLGSPNPTLHIADRAVPPYSASSPRPVLSVAVALFATLLLGIGAAIGLELVSPRVNREDDLLFVHRIPVLARVPRMSQRHVRDYLAGRSELPEEAWDAYRMLRVNLATAGPGGGFPRTILMASAIRGEGKTISTLNLAITLAAAGTRVIAVDGDLRRPMLATVFGVAARGNGFEDVFVKDAPLDRAVISAPGHDRLISLVLGGAEDALLDVLEPDRIARGLERLKQHADVIIIDSPPLTEVADGLTMAAAVDAVLVVTRLGYTRPDELSELRRMLALRGIAPTGFIVTTKRIQRPGGYHHATGKGRSQRLYPSARRASAGSGLRADPERGQS